MTLPTFVDYKNGTEGTRLTFERAYPGLTKEERGYEHERIYQTWDAETTERERNIARALFRHGEWAHESDLERESCAACVLRGFVSDSAREDGYQDSDGPNYAGWRRVYVQAGYPIPERWRTAFALDTDNQAYNDALGRDLVTFGHPGFTA